MAEKKPRFDQGFLMDQKALLEKKLADYLNLRRSLQQEVRVCSPEERKGDWAEIALTESERQKAAQQLEKSGEILPQIEKAKKQVDELLTGSGACGVSGEYGVCEDCGKAIPQKRLEAVPWALRCVACQEAMDQVALQIMLSRGTP
jgi:DnaK suppressor protein